MDNTDDNNVENKKDILELINILHKDLAKFFFSANIPFKTVENTYFLQFVRRLCKLQVYYKSPCRKTLATTVLKMLHMDVIENKRKLLRGTDSILLVDGWRNKSANKKYLVFTVRNINTPQTFLTFYDTSIETEDGENLAVNINEAIKIAKEVYDTNIYAIITDNDRKIVNGGRFARTVDNQELLSSTCSSHSGNLLIKSFVNDEFLIKIRAIVNTFREPKFESLLVRGGATKLKNFPDTRFCYYRDTCKSILKNLPLLKQLCLIEDLHLSANIMENLLDADFELTLTQIINNLDPICTLINKC